MLKCPKKLSISIASLLATCITTGSALAKTKFEEAFYTNYSNAVRAEKQNNNKQALNSYQAANMLAKRDAATLVKLGLLSLNVESTNREQSLMRAADYFSKAVSLNGGDVMTNLLLAKSFEELNNKEDALKYYIKAANLEPNNVLLRSNIGRLYFEEARFKDAIEIFNKVILAYPDNLKARGYLGASLQATDNYMSAIEQYNYVLKYLPEEYSILKNLGDSWLALGQYDKAKETYDKAVAVDPNVPNLYADLAFIAHKQNELDLAEKNYEKALKLKQDEAWERALAHTYWANKNDDKAIKAFEKIDEYAISAYIYQNKEDLNNAVEDYKKAIALDPKDHKSRFNLAQIYYSLGQKENAQKEYEAVLQQKPNDVEVIFLLASLRQELGDYSVAINYYKDLLDNYLVHKAELKEPITEDKKLFKNNVQYNLGIAYKMQQNFEAAEQSFEDLLDTDNHAKEFTKNRDVYKELSFIKIALGKNTEAEKIINGWLREDPASVEARNLYADFLIHLSDERKAIEQLRLASALDTTINTRLKLANLLHSQNNLFEALAEYQTILQDEPKNLNALQGAANNFKALGYKDEAIAMYKQIVEAYPNDVLSNYNYGLLLQENKDLENAKLQYEKVAQLNPSFSQTYYVLGLVYWDLGEKEKAKNIWQKFMANSNDEDLKKRVKLIIDSDEFTQG
jgi:tetratricopeptide (TPR) repeat protein